MSKRFFPQQQGDRKKAKLDISISDHNFPLSQNKESDQADTWGDDNDDEILLLASQACEEAFNSNDVSLLPDYSMCMQPGSTSTQMYPSPGPSTSKTEFTFKKPSTNPPSVISTNLREKCNRIASPLPGITAKVLPKANEPINLSDDFIFHDKIYKGQDSDVVYRQLLQLQEENAKLKSENGKLLDKCVTKEGEASILRTQLKTCQVAVDNARMDKIKAQEKVQMEWTDKIAAVNGQMHDLRTQLDFKNLEIISIKEKCKKLESTKVRLTQVTVANNDISSRTSNSFLQNESVTQNRRVKTLSNAVQTDDKAHFMDLNKTCKTDSTNLTMLLPHILERTPSPHSLLEYNEKLTNTDIPYKSRVYSTFHRGASSGTANKEGRGSVQLASVYEDVVKISNGSGDRDSYFKVFNAIKSILMDVLSRLETLSKRMTSAFLKAMDEKYIDTTSSFLDVSREELLKGRALYKEEQEILARRMTAILSYILEIPNSIDMLKDFEQSSNSKGYFNECIRKICDLIDSTSSASFYSGLLLSLSHTLRPLRPLRPPTPLSLVKCMITSRPLPVVCCRLLELVRDASLWENFTKEMCPGSADGACGAAGAGGAAGACGAAGAAGAGGNLKVDYDQGVLLFKKDSCYLQILLKQIEACLKCIESQELAQRAVDTTGQLILLYCNLSHGTEYLQDKSRCDCQLVLIQVIVYALRICAVMLQNSKTHSNADPLQSQGLLCTCRCGVQVLYRCTLKDVEFSSHLAHNEGHLTEFCEIMRTYEHAEVYVNMLSELASTLQSSPEDMPPSFHRQPWLKSFEAFSMAD